MKTFIPFKTFAEMEAAAKLTEDDVRAIRATYVPGCRTHGQSALARRYGVTQPLIGMIVRRELWAHAGLLG